VVFEELRQGTMSKAAPCGFGPATKALLLAAAVALAAPADAAVRNGVQTVDSTIVYLGIVPAALTRNHPGDIKGTLMHGGAPVGSIHDMHVMVALFDRATGARITNARVRARFLGERGRKWSVQLQPMTVNGALTYGGYTNLGTDEEPTVSVDILRQFAGKPRMVTARFAYEHD
jgi:hypothetical protein